MHFLIWETLSFNLMYVAACYLAGTGMCHNMVGLLQHYIGSRLPPDNYSTFRFLQITFPHFAIDRRLSAVQ